MTPSAYVPIIIPSGGGGDVPWQAGVAILVITWISLGLLACGIYRFEHDLEGKPGLLGWFNLTMFLLWPIMLPVLGLRYAWRHR